MPRRHKVNPARSAAARRGAETRRARAEVEAQFARLFEHVERGERAARSAAARRGWETRRRNEAERQAQREQAAARSAAARRGWETRRRNEAERQAQRERPAPATETVEPTIAGPDWVDTGADYFQVTDVNKSEVTSETRLIIDAGQLYQYDGLAVSFTPPEMRNPLDDKALAEINDRHGYWRVNHLFTIEHYLDADRNSWSLIKVTLDPDWLSKVETVEKLRAQVGGEAGNGVSGETMAQP